jgi:GNAT superfamily N-acetyltransferase
LTYQIRNLGAENLAGALELSTLAGWNQTAEDWRLLLDLAPQGCFCIKEDDKIAATATLLCYEETLAWIGMVLTHPNYRHRGFASALLKHALERAEALKIRTIKLDATEQGEALYKQFGFAHEQAIERWCRGPLDRQKRTASNSEPPANCLRGDFQADIDIDKDAFGANRSNLLAALLRRGACFSNSDGYVFTRSGRSTAQLGPCVATQKNEVSKLLKSAMGNFDSTEWSWDLLPQNLEAVSLAMEFGFLPNRRLVRMWRGEQLRPKEQLMYATAGFEFG